jgi:hypothetical protein
MYSVPFEMRLCQYMIHPKEVSIVLDSKHDTFTRMYLV